MELMPTSFQSNCLIHSDPPWYGATISCISELLHITFGFFWVKDYKGPPSPPHPHHFCKNYRDLKLGISHLMIPLMEALGVSSLGKIGFRSYGYLKTTDFYT